MVKIAGVQFIGHADKETNIATAIRMVREAAALYSLIFLFLLLKMWYTSSVAVIFSVDFE